MLARHELDGTDWCWLALGSEGRSEQTFASDQDNALVFAVRGGRRCAGARGCSRSRTT